MANTGYRYRSLFWPVVLIGVGIIWLLVNLNVLPAGGLWLLGRFWPLLLIWIGLDLLFGHRSPLLGAGLGILAVIVVVVVVVGGPTWGWGGATGSVELRHERFTEQLGQATSATVNLELSHAPTTITSPAESGVLIDADLRYRGTVDFEVSGGARRRVDLSHAGTSGIWIGNWGPTGKDEAWTISLAGGLPLDLSLDLSSGRTDADLRGVSARSILVEASSGSVTAQLPAVQAVRYSTNWEASSGDARVEVAPGATLDMELGMSSGSFVLVIGRDVDAQVRVKGSSGTLRIDVADDAAVQLDVRRSSSGSVRVPARMVEVQRGRDDEGVWETAGFADAARKVVIVVERMSSGDISIE